jgi:hypothetical protein
MAGFVYFPHFIFSWYLHVFQNINAIFNERVASVTPDNWQCVRYNNIISHRPVTKKSALPKQDPIIKVMLLSGHLRLFQQQNFGN